METFASFVASLVLFILAQTTNAANILAFIGTDLNSHFNAMSPILKNLAHYHKITLFATNDFKFKYENITVLDIPTYSATETIGKMKILHRPCQINSFSILYNYIIHTNESFYNMLYKSNSIKKLMMSKDVYDLMIINGYGTEQFIPFAQYFDIPILTIFPSYIFPWWETMMGGAANYESELNFGTSENSDYIYSRTKNFIKNTLLARRYFNEYIPLMEKSTTPYFSTKIPPIPEIYERRNKLIFVNSHSSIGIPRSPSPAIIEVGGAHINPPKALPSDLEIFLDSAEHGVIYFSLGSVIQGEMVRPDVIKAILRTFGKMRQNVLIKMSEEMEDMPKNIKVAKWFPQQDVLRHKNIRLFITQGGRLSILESLYVGVPILVMPVILDQKSNGQLAEKMHYGLSLDFCQFTEQLFEEKLNQLINDPKYKDRAEQVSEILQLDTADIKEEINFWVDYVIKYNGNSSHLPFRRNTFLQIIPADIFIVLLLVSLSIIFISYYTCKLLIKCSYRDRLKIKSN